MANLLLNTLAARGTIISTDLFPILPAGGTTLLSCTAANFLTYMEGALPAFTGDSGSGGVIGQVPAPAAGDGAAGKVLGASGGWIVPTYSTPSVANGTVMANFSGSSSAPIAMTLAAFCAAVGGQVANTIALGNDSRFTTPGQTVRTANYTLALADAAVCQYFTSTATLTLPNSVFVPETPIPIRVASGATVTITPGAGVTLLYAPSGATGARTMTGPAYAVLVYRSASEVWIGSGGIS